MNIENKSSSLIGETISQISILIIGAITFICGLAWNEAFTNYFDRYPSLKKRGLWFYALSVTIIGVIVIISTKYFTRKINNKEKENSSNSK